MVKIKIMSILYCHRHRHRHCDRIINHRRHQSHRRPTRYYNHCGIISLLLLIILIISLLSSPPSPLSPSTSSAWNNIFVEAAADENNLYTILGVSSKATIHEIKKAYRIKALDTHPDKNKNIPPELAAEQFQKVVHAFEVLSDVSSRQHYDRTGRAGSATDTAGSGGNGGSGGGAGNNGFGSGTNGFHWQFKWNTGSGHGGQSRQRYKRPKLKDRFDVKEAQSRLLHIVSLEQLETIITDDDGVLERNLLLCFYTPPLEDHVMNEMVYPWPFAAKSTQGIWWEDLLQTTVVRYHRSNSITDFFHIPLGDKLKQPIFIFGKRGTKFSELGGGNANNRLETDKRDVFDQWVWTSLQVPVTFINNHNSPIELYWIHDSTAKLKNIIQVGESITLTTMLSHEWWVRDVQTDTRKDSPGRYKLHNNTCLYSITIISDIRTIYTIPLRHCYDKSGHCTFWNAVGGNQECQRNAIFMNEVCPLTCGVCIKDDDDDDQDNDYDNEKNEKNEKNGNDEL